MKKSLAGAIDDNTMDVTRTTAETVDILHNPETWIIVGFVIFIAIFARFVLPIIIRGLDSRAATIRDQLEQASRLRAEAQLLLVAHQKQQEAMLKEAESIVATAQADAVQIRALAAEDLKQALDRRTSQAHEKITRAEMEAVAHIRSRIIAMATDNARLMLAERASGTQDELAISSAIAAIETQIH